MNIFDHYRTALLDLVARDMAAGELPQAPDLSPIHLRPPRRPELGDLSTNAAMVIAQQTGQKARTVADRLARLLCGLEGVQSVTIAGAGFLNVRLDPDVWVALCQSIIGDPAGFLANVSLLGLRVNVEFVSATPLGPLPLRFIRGAVLGDTLCRLLAAGGADVVREYYVNDMGAAVDLMVDHAVKAYRALFAGDDADHGKDPTHDGFGHEPTARAIALRVAADYGDGLLGVSADKVAEAVRPIAVDVALAGIRMELAALNVTHDSYRFETDLRASGLVDQVIEVMVEKGLTRRGILDVPDDRLPEDFEDVPQLLFKASDFGDTLDRPLRKSSGKATYFAADIAYHLDKLERGSDVLIDIWGQEHSVFTGRMQAAFKAMGETSPLDLQICQPLVVDAAGDDADGVSVSLTDLVARLGPDHLRFAALSGRFDTPQRLSVAEALLPRYDNDYFLIRYVQARAERSVRNHNSDLPRSSSVWRDEPVLTVLRRLAVWPDLVMRTQASRDIGLFVTELTKTARRLNDLIDHHRLTRQKTDPAQIAARVAVIRAAGSVMSEALAILGLDPVYRI